MITLLIIIMDTTPAAEAKIITVIINNVGSCNCPECRTIIKSALQQKFTEDPTRSYVYYGYKGTMYTYNGSFSILTYNS
jgi:hypothetical protein